MTLPRRRITVPSHGGLLFAAFFARLKGLVVLREVLPDLTQTVPQVLLGDVVLRLAERVVELLRLTSSFRRRLPRPRRTVVVEVRSRAVFLILGVVGGPVVRVLGHVDCDPPVLVLLLNELRLLRTRSRVENDVGDDAEGEVAGVLDERLVFRILYRHQVDIECHGIYDSLTYDAPDETLIVPHQRNGESRPLGTNGFGFLRLHHREGKPGNEHQVLHVLHHDVLHLACDDVQERGAENATDTTLVESNQRRGDAGDVLGEHVVTHLRRPASAPRSRYQERPADPHT